MQGRTHVCCTFYLYHENVCAIVTIVYTKRRQLLALTFFISIFMYAMNAWSICMYPGNVHSVMQQQITHDTFGSLAFRKESIPEQTDALTYE